MIRRILCLLTMLMLLTSSAAAEGAYQASITFDYSKEAATAAAKQLSGDESKQESLAQALCELVESVDIRLTVQDNAVRMDWIMLDTIKLDLSVFSTGREAFILSNMLPDHYAYAAVSQETADLSTQAADKLNKTDWKSVLGKVNDAFGTWLDTAFVGQEVGNYIGDAYEGGVCRLVFSFDDANLATLLDGLIGVLADFGIDDTLLSAWVGADGLLSSFTAYNAEVASSNQYSYTLYIVLNESSSPIGISLLTMKNREQVMSLSIGIGDNGWHVVWGYGLNQENIYIDLVLIDGQNANENDFSLTVYKDPYREGFRAVEPYLDYMQMLYTGTAGFSTSDQGTSWFADIESYAANATKPDAWYKLRGEYAGDSDMVSQTISRFLSNEEGAKPTETIYFNLAPSEPMTLSLDGLTALNVEDASFESEFSALITDAVSDLTIELIKKLPASLLTYFMQ